MGCTSSSRNRRVSFRPAIHGMGRERVPFRAVIYGTFVTEVPGPSIRGFDNHGCHSVPLFTTLRKDHVSLRTVIYDTSAGPGVIPYRYLRQIAMAGWHSVP